MGTDCKIIYLGSQSSFTVVAIVASAPGEEKSKFFSPLNHTCQYKTED